VKPGGDCGYISGGTVSRTVDTVDIIGLLGYTGVCLVTLRLPRHIATSLHGRNQLWGRGAKAHPVLVQAPQLSLGPPL